MTDRTKGKRLDTNSQRANGYFSDDPWEVARRHHEKQMHVFMVALMRHLKVTQVEIPMSEFLKDGTIEMTDRIDTGTLVYRIVGELELVK